MKNIFGILFVCRLVILENLSMIQGQECNGNSYTLIEDPKRSIMRFFDHTVDTALCDAYIDEELWYRFLSNGGEEIVERAAADFVPINRCGTESPIYIRGLNSHPLSDNARSEATVCANYDGNPCNWMETIEIYRCPAQGNQSVYYLYKLKAPPGCSLSYCVGERLPCIRGNYWNGIQCVNYFPPMSGFPLFSGPHITGSQWNREVFFACNVQYRRRPDDVRARFRITFLFDGRILEHVNGSARSAGLFEYLPSFYLTAANRSTQIVIGENYLRGRLGREISCKADSYWEGYEPGSGPQNSTMLSHSKFYASLESDVSTHNLNPSQGPTYEIVFRSTLPFTCRHCNSSAVACCKYVFDMKSEVAMGLTCSIPWRQADGFTMTAQVYILPGISQSEVSYGMTFEPYIGDHKHGSRSLWRDYAIPPVTVKAISPTVSYLYCYSLTDPNIGTFDNRWFSNLQVGDFYLVKTNQSMEIQVRQEVCSAGSCNCGVIVREGNSAIKLSICEKGPWNATVQRSPTIVRLLSQDPVDSSTVYRDGTGTQFSIRMPSGLRVEIYSWMPWFNIYVYLPPIYHNKTSSNSMCGNSNGNWSDDFYNLSHYRIPDAGNYFKIQPQCSEKFNAPVTKCDCVNTTVFKCSNSDKLLKMTSKSRDPLPERWNTGHICFQNKRVRRSYRGIREVEDSRETDRPTTESTDGSSISNADFLVDPADVFPPYSYDPNFGVNVSITWPTPKGKTELDVIQYCENIVNSSLVFKECNASVNVEEVITTCKTDIQVIDEWLPGDAYTATFEENCVNQLAAETNSSSSSDAGSNDTDTLSILISVYEKTCPNQCSGHGVCIEAICTCDRGYIGADCGMQENQPPRLSSINRNGLCDVSLRPCDAIAVFGSGVVSTAALKCRFTDESTGRHVETNGTFITTDEFSCPVPVTTTHRRKRSATAKRTALSRKDVSITMNEVVYSNTISLVIFDSTCMQCNSDTKECSQRSDACMISGECFANGATHANNRCLKCLPERSLSSWIDVTVVQEWTNCSRQCDYGVRSKDTMCSGTLESREVELCKATDCQENSDEEHQGVAFTFSEEDVKKILTEPDKFFNQISDALNSFCSTNASTCCRSVGRSTTGVASVSYASSNLTTFAVGYPVIAITDSQYRVKIIVKFDEDKLQSDCIETEAHSSSIVYAQPKLLLDAVSGAKSDIEKELGVTIKSLWSPEPAMSVSVTREPVTLETVTTDSAISEHVTQEPVTPEPATPEPVTSEQFTLKPTTLQPIAPEYDTVERPASETIVPKVVTQIPSSLEPVTTKHAASVPVTSTSFAPQPVATEYITSETVPPKVVTSMPSSSKSTTTEHAASVPVTSTSFASQPVVPQYVTPETVPPKVITSIPSSSKSITTNHATSVPVTSKSFASQPVVPEYVTPETVPSKVITSIPSSSKSITTKHATSVPVTSTSFASQPVVPEYVTPKTVPSKVITSIPSSSKFITTNHATSVPVTSKSFASQPVVPEYVTPETVPPKVIISIPSSSKSITTNLATSVPVTSTSFASQPVIPEYVTPETAPSKVITSIPSSSKSITTNYATSVPVTSTSFASQPVVPEYVTPETVPSKVITSIPSSSKSITTKHAASVPVTSTLITPKSVTPECITPKVATQLPSTRHPITKKPITLEPFIPKPVTQGPLDRMSISPETLTTVPITKVYVVPQPVTPVPVPHSSTASTVCFQLSLILGTYLLYTVL